MLADEMIFEKKLTQQLQNLHSLKEVTSELLAQACGRR